MHLLCASTGPPWSCVRPSFAGIFYFLFFLKNLDVLVFFKNKDLIKQSHCHFGASPLALWTRSPRATQCCCFDPASLATLLEQGAVNSPSLPTAAFEKALSCPVLWCLQGDKAFLSACPSLLLSGHFAERRSCYGAVYRWGVSWSPSERGGQRGAQHMKFPPHI